VSDATVDGPVASGRLARECWECGAVSPPGQRTCPLCGRPTSEAEVPFLVGRRYRLVRRLGVGGMGVVYQALDLLLDRAVAIKAAAPASPSSSASLRREARMLAALFHPHLVAVHDLYLWRGGPLLILELLAGGTLEERVVAGEALPLDKVMAIGLGVGAALAHLHERGLVHGDVKPANVGFTLDGTPKLLDFGLARRASATCEASLRSTACTARHTSVYGEERPPDRARVYGTLNYLSPESLDGTAAQPAADLWALGVVLWEAATGRRLFPGRDAGAVVRSIRHAEVPPLPGETPHAAVLATAVSAALHSDPSRRCEAYGDVMARLATA
jgi:eukaryotic-like serine/threonine-protein kinase